MGTLDTHRVRRLQWQARAGVPAQAFALRGLLRERAEAVQSLLERVLESVAPAGEVRRLPRLELQLHGASVEELRDALLPRLEIALRDALARALNELPHVDETAGGAPRQTPRALSTAVEAREALRHYLARGDLPWTLAGSAPEALQRLLESAALMALDEVLAQRSALDTLLPAEATRRLGALVRWLRLLPDEARRRWLRASPRASMPPLPWREQWQAWVDDEARERIDAQALWLAWPEGGTGPPEPASVRALQAALDLRLSIDAARAGWPGDLAAQVRDWLATLTGGGTARPASPAPAALRADASTAASTSATAGTPAAEVADDSATLVPLAGLVLLHPYLPRLLRGCGVVVEGARRIDDAQWPRACALLHALACGDDEPAEHALPLVKLLLGRRPDEALDAAPPELNAEERAEVAALLDAVRTHWAALRGTGVDALRVSFLQRRGLLRRRDGAWLLQMQTESFDMLLSLLPWSIGLVKLPWMPQPLMVEWATP